MTYRPEHRQGGFGGVLDFHALGDQGATTGVGRPAATATAR